jgi:hypothetical protein
VATAKPSKRSAQSFPTALARSEFRTSSKGHTGRTSRRIGQDGVLLARHIASGQRRTLSASTFGASVDVDGLTGGGVGGWPVSDELVERGFGCWGSANDIDKFTKGRGHIRVF